MKKIINDPKQVVEEMLQGMVKSYPDYLKPIPETGVVYRTDLAKIAAKSASLAVAEVGTNPRTLLCRCGNAECSGLWRGLYFSDSRPNF